MIITQEIFEAFLHCPTKSHLFCRPDVPDATPSQERRPEEESFQQSGSSRLHASVPDHEVYTGTPTAETIKRKIYRMILDYTALATDLRAHLHGLELVHAASTKNLSVDQYIPIRFVAAERISAAHGFLLAFDALVFSQAVSTPLPHIGKLVHGRGYSTTTVVLTPLYTKVRSVIAAIWAQQATPTRTEQTLCPMPIRIAMPPNRDGSERSESSCKDKCKGTPRVSRERYFHRETVVVYVPAQAAH